MTAVCPVCDAPQDEGLVCHACTTALERDLGDVPAIVTELDVTISRQARIGTGGGKGGLASERTPVHLGAVQVADDLTNTLTTWARDVTHVSADRFLFVPDASAAAVILLADVSAIRRHPAAAELFDEITDAIRQARRVVDRPADRVYLGTCMYEEAGVTCEAEVYANQDAKTTTCRVCGIEHDVSERRAWLLMRAQDLLVTVKEASRYMGEVGGIRVTEASIRGYLHRGRLGYRAGGPTIRLGDLLSVVIDEGERRSA